MLRRKLFSAFLFSPYAVETVPQMRAHQTIRALVPILWVAIAALAWAAPHEEVQFAHSGIHHPDVVVPVERPPHADVFGVEGPVAEEIPEFIDTSSCADSLQAPSGCGGACGERSKCGSHGIYRSGWTLSFDASALQSHMASRDVDAWPNDFGPAGRVTLGYEASNGLGLRAQAWGYGVSGPSYIHYFETFFIPGALNRPLYVSEYYYNNYYYYFGNYDDISYSPLAVRSATYADEIELSMASAYLDFYKTIASPSSELVVGFGAAFGHVEFNMPPAGDGTKYAGGGLTAFSQATVPFIQRPRWGLAISGQARLTLLTGDWHIDRPPLTLVDTTSEHSNSMSIVELGFGPELRRRLGRSGTHYWFVRVLAEYQQWRSDRMGPMAGDTLALQGATVNFGVNW